jgi:predicted nucleotidyltransferase component of viral defense system
VIPQANITAWRSIAPWPDDSQVEQDLVLSRTVVELFSEPALMGKIAIRGGTALNKLFINPECRYSEDVDLVQTEAAPIGPILDAIRGTLDSWLEKPARKRSGDNASLTYRFASEIPPVRPLRLKIEINTREHFTVLGFQSRPFTVDNPWFRGEAEVKTYTLDELMGTKLRALYQRRKSRDLFDLWFCIDRGLLNADRVVDCFGKYVSHEGHSVSRAQFEQNLYEKETDPEFMDDIAPLLSDSVDYDPIAAMAVVRRVLIGRIPGDPWRGPG